MRLAVFWARSRIGWLAVEVPCGASREALALIKRGGSVPDVAGPAFGPRVLADARGCDAAASVTTSGKDDPSCPDAARVSRAQGGLRDAGFGHADEEKPGARRDGADRPISEPGQTAANGGALNRRKQRECCRSSQLRSTMRPAQQMNGPAKGAARPTLERRPSIRISHADLSRDLDDVPAGEGVVSSVPFAST